MKFKDILHWVLKFSLAPILIICISLSSYGIELKDVVGAWLFDQQIGKTAIDSSPNQFDGELINDPKWTLGKYGGGIELRGDNYVKVPHDWDGRQDLQKFTLAAWVRFSAVNGTYGGIVTKKSTGGSRRAFGIAVSSNGVVRGALTIAKQAQEIDSEEQVLDDTWHHVALTYDGEEMRIYVDGELDHDKQIEIEGKPDRCAGPIEIGRWGKDYPIGIIDEVGIFNVALSDKEIQEIMKGLAEFMKVELAGKLTTTWASIKSRY